MKRIFGILASLAIAVSFAHAQTDNTLYVKNFPGANVGAKVAAAQKSCNADTAVPCILVIDPSLAAASPGVLPALCSQCYVLDYRNGPPDLIPSEAINVKSYGAKGNGSTDDFVAVSAALAAAHAKGQSLYFPAGNYILNNQGGPLTVDGFSGTIRGDAGSTTLTFTSLGNYGFSLTNPSHLYIRDLIMTNSATVGQCNPQTTNCGTQRGANPNGRLLFVSGGNDVHISDLFLHDGGIVGLDVESSTHVFLNRIQTVNFWANSYFLVNDVDLHGDSLSAYYGQDADFELSTYSGQTIPYGHDAILTNLTSYGSFSCVLVNSWQNVVVDGFTCSETWLGGLSVRQDATTTTEYWPDHVKFSHGTIKNIGSGNPPNFNVTAIETIANDTAPPAGTHLHFSFSDIDISGDVVNGANSVLTANDATHDITFDDIRVIASQKACFDLSGGNITATRLLCDGALNYPIINRSTLSTYIADSRINDAFLTPDNDVALLNASTGSLLVDGLFLFDDRTTARQAVYDPAASGKHVFRNLNFVNTDGSIPLVSSASPNFVSDGITVNGVFQVGSPSLAGTSGSIGGSPLTAGTCTGGTVSIPAAAVGMTATASPATNPGDAFHWRAYVSSAGTVAVSVCTDVAAGGTPTATVYNVRVTR